MAWLYVLVVVWGWFLADRIGERSLFTMFLAYTPPLVWLLLATAPIVWALWAERRITVSLLGAVIALMGTGILHWRIQKPGELKILTYNVAAGANVTPRQMAQFLNSTNAQVILLQETKYVDPNFRKILKQFMPQYAVSHANGVSTMSRLPMMTARKYPLPGLNREVLVTQLRWNQGVIHVVNAHLGATQFGSILKGQPHKLVQSSNARAQQVELLISIAKNTSGNLILGGDLNTPPRGVFYRRLTSYYGPGSHDMAGRGIGWTYPDLRLRIDHIMASDLKATKSEVLNVGYSDHRPVLAQYK